MTSRKRITSPSESDIASTRGASCHATLSWNGALRRHHGLEVSPGATQGFKICRDRGEQAHVDPVSCQATSKSLQSSACPLAMSLNRIPNTFWTSCATKLTWPHGRTEPLAFNQSTVLAHPPCHTPRKGPLNFLPGKGFHRLQQHWGLNSRRT